MAKTCTRCGNTKPLADFNRDRRKGDGLSSWCKLCLNANGREYRQRKLEQYRAANRRWNETHREQLLAGQRAWRARQRAKSEGGA